MVGALTLRVVVPLSTMLAIGALALLLLLTPFYLHPALERTGAPAALGVGPHVVNQYSDRTVRELFFGPGTFELPGLESGFFYNANERAHLRDVRVVLLGFLALAAVAAASLVIVGVRRRRDAAYFEALARGGTWLAVGTVFAGVFTAVAFGIAFELFHRLLFPGGNYSFDPTTDRLVQLYPYAFWQLTALAMGALLLVGGLLVRVYAARHSRRLLGRPLGGA